MKHSVRLLPLLITLLAPLSSAEPTNAAEAAEAAAKKAAEVQPTWGRPALSH